MTTDWKCQTLDEACQFSNGLWKGEKPPFERVGVIRNTNFTKEGTLDYSDIAYLDVEVKKLEKRSLQFGDVILEKSGGGPKQPVGRVVLFDKPEGVFSFSNFTSALRIRDPKTLDFRFLHKFLHWTYVSGITEGMQSHSTGIRNLDGDAYKAIEIKYPTLTEQQRIVTLLDDAFDGIAIARAHAEKNLQNARTIFLSQREVILAPKAGWHEAPLAELCDVKHGYAFEGAFFAQTGDYVLLTPGSFFEAGGYRERGEKTKFYVGQIPGDYILKAGDLLVAMTEQAAGLLGSPLLVPESDRFLHNQRLGLITAKPGVPWLNAFFFHVFNLGRVRQEIHASASGVKVRHTSPGRIGAVPVAYPTSIEEQRHIAEQLCELLDECKRLESIYQRKIAALDALKKSLLQQAFSGQLTSAKQVSAPQRLALQTTTPEFTANVISFAYAQHERKKREKTFGHVKEQKVLHLIESIAGIDLGRQPMRNAAGPNDFAHMLNAEEWAKAHGFFEVTKRDGGYEFKKLSAFDDHMSRARQALAPYLPQLERVIDLLVPMDTAEAEVFATVHAAWNNLLIDGMEVTDDTIVSAAREDWHADKLKIPEHKFRTAIALIRKKNLVPDGTAKYVGDQHRLI